MIKPKPVNNWNFWLVVNNDIMIKPGLTQEPPRSDTLIVEPKPNS